MSRQEYDQVSLNCIFADLHIHSALSPCAENIMSPRLILQKAKSAGLNLISITDHNNSTNSITAAKIAAEYGLSFIPGMELTTREEVHLLAFFPGCEELKDFQSLVNSLLPKFKNDPESFGLQLIYDEKDEIIDVDEQIRFLAVNLGIDDAIREIHQRNGLAVPSHIFRSRFSLISQLGFVDPEANYDFVEICNNRWNLEKMSPGDKVCGFTALTSSDAHFLEDVGKIRFPLSEDYQKIVALANPKAKQ